MSHAPTPADVLRLGAQTAAIKASMPKKRWAKFVKLAHARGFTINAMLSDSPDALKERTTASLRAEAQKTVTAAYAPADKALTTRQAAIGILDDKRKTDDAAYRQWLSGEVGKLDAQAKAADASLASQQQSIQDGLATSIAASHADSMKRAAAVSSVSDPAQSTALDTSAADTHSAQRAAAATQQTATLAKVGGDARVLANASLLSQQSARESQRIGETLKALADVSSSRDKLNSDKAGALTSQLDTLTQRNTTIAQGNRDAQLAGASLGLKQDELAQTVADATRKYNLEQKKFGLDQWKATHAAEVAKAKVQLGYDQIASREGVAAAKRKLDERLAKIRAAQKRTTQNDKKKGVTTEERSLYRNVTTAEGIIARWHKNNTYPPDQIRQQLRSQFGLDDITIDVANDLWANGGHLSNSGRVKARKLGIIHSGYFWKPLPGEPGGPAGPPA